MEIIEDPSARQTSSQTPLTIWQDSNGDKSSGRHIKIFAFWFAVLISIVGITLAGIALFTQKPVQTGISSTRVMDGPTFVGLILGLVGVFGSIALGSEITQKTTRL